MGISVGWTVYIETLRGVGLLFGGFGVSNGCVDHLDDLFVFVDAVPDSAACGDFVLPLFHLYPTDTPVCECSFEGVLTAVPVFGVGCYFLPRYPSVRRGC